MKYPKLLSAAVFVAPLLSANPSFARSETLQNLENQGFGNLSGRIQSLMMYRDYNNGVNGGSGTVALTLDYTTPEFYGFSARTQYIQSEKLFDSGYRKANGDAKNDAAYGTLNDDFNEFNFAYLNYNAHDLGYENTEIRVGRQLANYDFMTPTYIRQKEQAYEGAVVSLGDIQNLKLDVGFISRFSTWGSRESDNNQTKYRSEFTDIHDMLALGYETNGLYFISATYDINEVTSVTFYDYLAHDAYNNFGLKGSYTIDLGMGDSLTFKAHYSQQDDESKYERFHGSHESNMTEISACYKTGALSTTLGAISVNGSDDFKHPFGTTFSSDPLLLGYTQAYDHGSDSLFLQSLYKMDKWTFFGLYVISDSNESLNQELDIITKYNVTEDFYVTLKAGIGHQDIDGNGDNKHATDGRIFMGYTF